MANTIGYPDIVLLKQMATAAKRQNAIEAAIAPYQRVLDKLKQKQHGGHCRAVPIRARNGAEAGRRRRDHAPATRRASGRIGRDVALGASVDVAVLITAKRGTPRGPPSYSRIDTQPASQATSPAATCS